MRRSIALSFATEEGEEAAAAAEDDDPLLANFKKSAALQAKFYGEGWGAMNDTVREERGLVQSTKL